MCTSIVLEGVRDIESRKEPDLANASPTVASVGSTQWGCGGPPARTGGSLMPEFREQ